MKLPIPWQRAERGAPPVIDLAHVGEAIAQCRAGDQSSIGPHTDQWAEIVLRFSNTDLLAGPQNALVFGTKPMGRQAVVTRIANLVNTRFSAERHAAVYVDLQQMVSASTVYTWTSVDAVYRELISSPLSWVRTKLRLKPDRELQKHETQLAALLDTPVSKLNALALRDTFYAWMDRLNVRSLSFYIDDVSALAPGFIPVLLQMLLDTFPRGGRVSFKLAGLKQALKLEERAKRGAVGMQFSHDILVGLDLEQLLQTSDVNASSFDPRQVFLLTCIQKLAPGLAARVEPKPDPTWENLFDPPGVWVNLFKGADYDMEVIGIALENLLPGLSESADLKADPLKVDQAVERARAQAGLRKPPAPVR